MKLTLLYPTIALTQQLFSWDCPFNVAKAFCFWIVFKDYEFLNIQVNYYRFLEIVMI